LTFEILELEIYTTTSTAAAAAAQTQETREEDAAHFLVVPSKWYHMCECVCVCVALHGNASYKRVSSSGINGKKKVLERATNDGPPFSSSSSSTSSPVSL
jgi:hypothetical protein